MRRIGCPFKVRTKGYNEGFMNNILKPNPTAKVEDTKQNPQESKNQTLLGSWMPTTTLIIREMGL